MGLYYAKQELELRIETQKQTLQSRDESIKKLLEMLQNKGMGECKAFNTTHRGEHFSFFSFFFLSFSKSGPSLMCVSRYR